MAEITGRVAERRILEALRVSGESEFLAIYGRRRVGKTFLIHETFKHEEVYFELTGAHGASKREQLRNFARAFDRCFVSAHPSTPPPSWPEAFERLRVAVESIAPKRAVIFLDELPWLASRRSRFLSALEHFWNSWASRRGGILLIVCGSAASWMLDKVVRSKGGLHNRITRRIRLLPFTLIEAEQYLRSRGVRLDRKQVLELFMAMGGVPLYLRQVLPGRSAAQNIDSVCFSKDGLLADEFTLLFASLFDRPEPYIDVVRTLAGRRSGLTRSELLRRTGLRSGGGASKILDALEQAGFIDSYLPFGKRTYDATIRLVDEYSLFFLTWIATAPRSVFRSDGSGYWSELRSRRSWQAWSGYSFEGICLKHVRQLKAGLGIRAVSTTEASWRWTTSDSSTRGVELVLVIDRRDHCITLCEMKYSDHEYVISKGYAALLRRKRDTFREQTRTRKTVFLAMVTTHGTRENSHYVDLIDDQVTMEDLFGRASS